MEFFSDLTVVRIPQSAVFTFLFFSFISGKKNDDLGLHNVDIVCGVVILDIDLMETSDLLSM